MEMQMLWCLCMSYTVCRSSPCTKTFQLILRFAADLQQSMSRPIASLNCNLIFVVSEQDSHFWSWFLYVTYKHFSQHIDKNMLLHDDQSYFSILCVSAIRTKWQAGRPPARAPGVDCRGLHLAGTASTAPGRHGTVSPSMFFFMCGSYLCMNWLLWN